MSRCIRQLFLFLLFYCALDGEAAPTLSSNDVASVMAQALTRAYSFLIDGTTTNAVVAVVDREGFVLGAWSLQAAHIGTVDPFTETLAVINAISKAGTAAFLSSDQNAFTSRTAGYIVQQHFPPLIKNTAPGPLVGVNFSSMAFSDINRYKLPLTYNPRAYGGGGTNGAPIVTNVPANAVFQPLTGLNGSPGGVPLYKAGHLVGGIGAAVSGKGPIPELADIQLITGETYDVDEDVALAGQNGFQPAPAIWASQVLIGGIRLPYVNRTTQLIKPHSIDPSVARIMTIYEITSSPPVNYPALSLEGVGGEIRAPIIDDPVAGNIDIRGARLKAGEVTEILAIAAKAATTIRAGIRLPIGTSAKVFITVVNNPAQAGVTPVVLGTFRISDATIFSWDVAVQKARTALFFSSNRGAYSTRAIGFLAQSLYPPGIDGTESGPLFGLQEIYSLLQVGVTSPLNGIYLSDHELPLNPLISTASTPLVPFISTHPIASIPLQAPDPSLPNGITIFPGGFPLYRNGVLIGAIGVSGDGVDQDDLIACWGTVNFLAPNLIRSDQLIYRGTRLPYAKFPRNPTR